MAHAALALMPHDDWREAALPLFEQGKVDAVEWSFDVMPDRQRPPPWLAGLLDHYARSGRLYAHGVTYSLLSAGDEPAQARWLARLAAECARRPARHVSEHLGFLRAGDLVDGPPLPVPISPTTLALGRGRLARLADTARCPVGLENLAFAFGRADVAAQGGFLDELLAPGDGFLVLDLHNLHCQLENFGLQVDALLRSYPLHRVRELHVSGGSWREHCGRRVRRDTHDDAVPRAVWDLLRAVLPLCPNTECVVLERLGGTLAGDAARARMRADFDILGSITGGEDA
jgi:uncharacterized protein (UPF0276 family)